MTSIRTCLMTILFATSILSQSDNQLRVGVINRSTTCHIKSAKGDDLVVHYNGTLLDGTVFDSSVTRGKPFKFKLGVGEVIPGWDQGLENMCIGERRQLNVPSHLAYGEQGAGNVIPPGATLQFDVRLLELPQKEAVLRKQLAEAKEVQQRQILEEQQKQQLRPQRRPERQPQKEVRDTQNNKEQSKFLQAETGHERIVRRPDPVVDSPSELQLQTLVNPNSCPTAAHGGDMVTVHYAGYFSDGRKFDSSLDRSEPFTFKLGSGQVIPGWEQGVAGMCVGERRRLEIPHHLAYGERGVGDIIPPKSKLIFDIQLLDLS